MRIATFVIIVFFTSCEGEKSTRHKASPVEQLAINALHDFKSQYKIKGLAFALFDEKDIITEFCLGKSTYGFPINNETLFSIQSISKNFTAMAALVAEEDSLIDLDEPISEYLPDFNMNSCFNEHPEDQITIRMMLTHTAGFTHEAPVGNNFDYREIEIGDHLKSISQTWLKFPPGTSFFYSNLGYDLTAQIIEIESGQSFNNYLKENIFSQTGMLYTTVNDEEVLANENRTEGAMSFLTPTHIKIPLIGSGAVYTSLKDLVKYTQIHLNRGQMNSHQIISEESLDEMYKINRNHYGLGTHIDKSQGRYYINHNGGGYGYTSTMIFFPEFRLGAVLLCNGESATFNICAKLINKYIDQQNLTKDSEATRTLAELNADYFKNPTKYDTEDFHQCIGIEEYQESWKAFEGSYSLLVPGYNLTWYVKLALAVGYRPVKLEVYKNDNKLIFKDWNGESILTEMKPGFFFTADGEVVDFTTDTPTYRNILLEKL
jgi:CubicO group peptidase (beta-lactamase class C family)